MARVLIVFAHPSLQNSRIHTRLLGGVSGVQDVTLRDLYQLYPEFDVDVVAEQELLAAGVTHVYRDTLDTSLRAGQDALGLLGTRAYAAHRATQTFRRHDEESLRRLSDMVDDRTTYISTARARIQDLERMMRLDMEEAQDARDAGWDAESLREDFGER